MTKNNRFKLARERLGLSQQEIATKMSENRPDTVVRQSYIAQIESGKGFSLKQAKVFAPILNVTPEWLFFGDEKDINNGSNENVTKEIKPIGNAESDANAFSDSRPVNHGLGYDENSTFPERGKSPSNEWKILYFNQQEQIRLLNKQIELLNQIIQQ